MPVRQANNPVKPVGFTQSPVQRPASTFQYISQQRFALGQIHAKRFYRQFTAARSSGPAGVVPRCRRLGKRPPPIQDANVPLPHVQGVADVEELLLPVQLKLVQCFRPRLPPEAVES
jgi:hypothetical protein